MDEVSLTALDHHLSDYNFRVASHLRLGYPGFNRFTFLYAMRDIVSARKWASNDEFTYLL
jgi:hypothetical protein